MVFAPFSTAYTPEPKSCSGSEKPGARILQDWLCDESPWGAWLWDIGIYNCRFIGGTNTLSQHASGRAGDSAHTIITATSPDSSHPKAIEAARWLAANHAILGIQEVISNRQRWDNQARRWESYGGQSPHIDHIHWTLNQSGGLYLTRARILSVAPAAPQPTPDPTPTPIPDLTGDFTMTVLRRRENPAQSVLVLPDKTTKIGVKGFFSVSTNVVGNEGINSDDEVLLDKSAWARIVDTWLKGNGALVSA